MKRTNDRWRSLNEFLKAISLFTQRIEGIHSFCHIDDYDHNRSPAVFAYPGLVVYAKFKRIVSFSIRCEPEFIANALARQGAIQAWLNLLPCIWQYVWYPTTYDLFRFQAEYGGISLVRKQVPILSVNHDQADLGGIGN